MARIKGIAQSEANDEVRQIFAEQMKRHDAEKDPYVRCTQSSHSNVLVKYASARRSSGALLLSLFEQLAK